MNYPSLEEQNKIASFLNIIESKIKILESKINILKKYKEGLMINAYLKESSKPMNLSKALAKKEIEIGRGRIIPKQSGQYPVYSSSAQNNGFFCNCPTFDFNQQLITWSIDGGGKPFLRAKHKFSITNVCGYAKILKTYKWTYEWLYINFWYNWHHEKFDYINKAHPSVISKLYKIKEANCSEQNKWSMIISSLDKRISNLTLKSDLLLSVKRELLNDLFI